MRDETVERPERITGHGGTDSEDQSASGKERSERQGAGELKDLQVPSDREAVKRMVKPGRCLDTGDPCPKVFRARESCGSELSTRVGGQVTALLFT